MLRHSIKTFLAIVLYYSGFIGIIRVLGRHYAKILVYHSISDRESIFVRGTGMWVSPVIFHKHLNYIRRNYQLISLRTLVDSLKEGWIPPRSVVLTFDDGFADNFHFVYPYLKRNNIEATIFLTTDCIDNKKATWIQELNYLINNVDVQGVIRGINALAQELGTNGLIIETNSETNIRKQVEEYLGYCVSKKLRDTMLTRLYGEFNIRKKKVFSENQLFLTKDQMFQMCGNGIYFGSHGSSHTPFSAMTLPEQREEILNSRRVIEKDFAQDFLPFSYPFGKAKDYSPDTRAIIENTGHDCIVTAMPTLNHGDTSPYELGRIDVRNVPVHTLAFELEKGVLKHLIVKGKSRLREVING
ncbi:MAG: polysaccharide deacetylase family protein [Candidatus Aenigmarchaeota archaeon]|nr:polysaccharide deacetylase family protein [Candidatus Aenigmarchaeota archaeon]